MAPFTARSRSSASSVLTTLDGGVARGYAGIPQVERAVAVHLCPRNAATWRNRPRLPSKACKLTAALAAKAYSAAGQAASALHAMAILQVHQAKALKQVHEGSTDPGLMQELRTATDFALRATKVTARSLGKAMSTMVVQERHLWLNLAEMKDVDKARFLDAPISQGGLFATPSRASPSSSRRYSSRPRRSSFVLFLFRRWSKGQRYPPSQRKSNFLFLRVFRSMGRQCATPCLLTLAHDPFCQ